MSKLRFYLNEKQSVLEPRQRKDAASTVFPPASAPWTAQRNINTLPCLTQISVLERISGDQL